jgi:hypothetical protein
MLVGFPGILGKRSLEVQTLVDIHVVQMLRHRAVRVAFDNKLEVTGLIFIASGSVRADNWLRAIGRRILGQKSRGDVKTGDSLLVGELEAQSLSVVAQNLNARQLEVHPSLVSACEDLGTLSWSLCGGSTGLVAVQSNTKTSQTYSHIDGGKRLALGGFGRVLAGALTVLVVN